MVACTGIVADAKRNKYWDAHPHAHTRFPTNANTHGVLYCSGSANADTHAYSQEYGHCHTERVTQRDSRAHTFALTERDSNANKLAHGYGYLVAFGDGNANANSNGISNALALRHPVGISDTDLESIPNFIAYSLSHSHSDSLPECNPNTVSLSYRLTNSDPKSNTDEDHHSVDHADAEPVFNGHAQFHANRVPDANRNFVPNGHPHSDGNALRNAKSHSDNYVDADHHAYPHSHPHSDALADQYLDGHAHADAHLHTHRDGHEYADTESNAHLDSDAVADGYTVADTYPNGARSQRHGVRSGCASRRLRFLL
jgi:hypothetical protein